MTGFYMIRTLAVRRLRFVVSVFNASQPATKLLTSVVLVHGELIHRYLTESNCE